MCESMEGPPALLPCCKNIKRVQMGNVYANNKFEDILVDLIELHITVPYWSEITLGKMDGIGLG
tara:strand:+ start:401 stop:592 length:192 start_codon:yes stop_codon:yes gene_type:complete